MRPEAVTTGDIERALGESAALHKQLWSRAESVAEQDGHSIITGLSIQSLNQTIDLHAERVLIGLQSRIPIILWLVLYLLAVFSMVQLGYQAGLCASRRSLAGVSLVLSFSLVIVLTADLDRQREGLIHVSQEPMIELQRSWAPAADQSQSP